MYTNIFLFGERILPEYHTCRIGLSTHVFLVNHWHDILNCSYKWFTVIVTDPVTRLGHRGAAPMNVALVGSSLGGYVQVF